VLESNPLRLALLDAIYWLLGQELLEKSTGFVEQPILGKWPLQVIITLAVRKLKIRWAHS